MNGELSPSGAGGGPQVQRLQLCRHEMQHFVLALQGYLTGQVLQVSWAELRRELLVSVHTLDELRAAHVGYIRHAARRCLLNAKSEPIMKIVQDVLRIVLKFHAQLSAVQWTVDADGQVVHPTFAAVMKTHRQFSGYSRFLFKVVNKTKDRFYQPHLNDLANRLNFNGFYTSDVGPV
ncbi:Gamma-tubulin complex component 6 [Amphibalanus amphitrite]|uniref:Gamma-tubulin complex component n=1 Tax=Amphibalanus amphitrite TaxID=1232801 RepID=A0A6A4V2Z4_AMPAM|nr:Gamma-tubulin complex component 6 [Amphibalanus amphitrite]